MNTDLQAVRDPLWGHIYLSKAFYNITLSAPFMRLHRIMQLGPCHYTYPGATHTRASHSLGVYYLGRRILERLLDAGAKEWVSDEGSASFLAACLLHDVGHFPYTHSLKEFEYAGRGSGFPPFRTHEDLSAELVLNEPLYSLLKEAGAVPEMVAAIIYPAASTPHPAKCSTFRIYPAKGEENCKLGYPPPLAGGVGGGVPKELTFYQKILSGPLDPDKLDYLNRDAYFCGVPYGAQDVDFILGRLFPSPERGVDIDSRGIISMETLLFSKYLMYRSVYWHKNVRSATAMLKKAIWQGLVAGKISPESLYNLDDAGLIKLLSPLSPFPQMIVEGKLYQAVLETPFDAEKHQFLLDLEQRSALEKKLGEENGGNELIIDIPESISFENTLFINDENTWFPGKTGVFTNDVVQGFSRNLRVIRVFAEEKTFHPCKISEKELYL